MLGLAYLKSRTLWLLTALLFALIGCAGTHIPRECGTENPPVLADDKQGHDFIVNLKSKCNPSGIRFEADRNYVFKVEPLTLLADGRVLCKPPNYSGTDAECREPLGPEGFKATDLPWWMRAFLWVAGPFRPMNDQDAGWLELVGRVGDADGKFFHVTQYSSQNNAFKSERDGELFVLANDYPWLWRYCNNQGVLRVTVTRADVHEGTAELH